MSKILLVETAVAVHANGSKLLESTGAPGYLVESSRPRPGVLMTVKLPATTLDKMNENKRTYRRTIMDSAMRRCKPSFESRSLLSSVNEHPEDPYVTPGQASHIVVEAWCEDDGYLWNRWDVLDTATGRDLAALVEAQASFGVSIRGLGSQDNLGNIQDDYEFLGTDCVGQPSAKIRTAPEKLNNQEAGKSATTESTRTPQLETVGMKTRADATRYVKEQVILMKSESKMDALRRIMQVEASLAGSSLPASELLGAYGLLESSKDSFDKSLNEASDKTNRNDTASTDIQKERVAFRESVNKLVQAFRGRMQETEKKHKDAMAKVESRNVALKKRVQDLSGRVLETGKKLRRENTKNKINAKTRLRLADSNAALKVQLREATDLAVSKTLETNVAIREAAIATVAARKAKKESAPATVVKTSAVKESKNKVDNSKIVRSETGLRAVGADRKSENTKVPNWI